MAGSKSELVDTVLYLGETYEVMGIYDRDTPEREHDFFDVYSNSSGDCLSEGNPFFERPTRQDVIEVIKDYMKATGNAEESKAWNRGLL
jgi:hypothetical protein